MFWITEEAMRDWEEKQRTGKRGKPEFFSNTAIKTALTTKEVFHLPLRQTEGFLTSIFQRIGMALKAPDHSTLSLRAETLLVTIRVSAPRDEPLHIVVDSTGAKVHGDGEWRVRQHGNAHAPPFTRDENLRRIREMGRKKWKEESWYHRRSIAENAMFRLKTVFTDKVRAVKLVNQRVQLLLRCKSLNRMNTLGMPESYLVT